MDYEEIIKEQMKNVEGTDELDSISEYAAGLSEGLTDQYTLDRILESSIKGESIFDANEIISSLKDLLLYEIKLTIALGIEILIVCIVVGLLKNLSGSFGKKNVADIALLICSVIIIGLCINNFRVVYEMTVDTVATLTYTVEIILPILLTVLISMGAVSSGTIMSPVLLTSVAIFGAILKNVVLPAVFISTILVLINSLTEKDYVNKLSKFLRNASLFAVGILITILTGIITVQGLVAETSDTLLMNTARYSISKFIPIVGDFTSDTLGLFIKCMSSIKGVVGIFGIITIVLLIIMPIIKILAIAAIYKVTSFLTEPITDSKLSDCLSDMGNAMITMGAILFFTSLLFIIFLATVINLGGNL